MSGRSYDLVDGRYCVNCGFSHAKQDRLTRLKRLLPATSLEIQSIWSCVYDGPHGLDLLIRDLKAVGARREKQLGSASRFDGLREREWRIE